MDDSEFFARMSERVARRYRINAAKSLRDVYRLDPDFLDTDNDAQFAIRNRDKIVALLADEDKFDRLVDLFVNQSIEFTYASNQFVQIDAREETVMRTIYTQYLREMGQMLERSASPEAIASGLNNLVAGHFQDLRANITRFFDPEVRTNPDANVILHKVVCADYTPKLQVEILGLHDLIEPVLDLGCGKEGGLVTYLRAAGLQATGVDRVVADRPGLVQAGWLDFPLAPESWGTVISHMAFSNHFIFQHLYQRGSVEPYARRYMTILRSLKPGGSFYYTPGLPFIEAYLPAEQYRLTRKPVPGAASEYACRVQRMV
jgi:hypothetical protein